MAGEMKAPKALDPAVFAERMQGIAAKSQAVVQEFLMNRPDVVQLGMGDSNQIGKAFFDFSNKVASDPTSILRAQVDFWMQGVNMWAQATRRLLGDQTVAAAPAPAPDKRFKKSGMVRERGVQLHPRQLSALGARDPVVRAWRQGT